MSNLHQHVVQALPITATKFQDSSHNHKFSWGLIMIFLLTQLTAAQDSVTTVKDFVSVRNSTERSPSSTITNIVGIKSIKSTDLSWSTKSVDEAPYLTNHSKKLKLNSNETDSVTEIISESDIDTISFTPNHFKREINEQVKDDILGEIDLVHLDITSYDTNANATELKKEDNLNETLDQAYTEDLDIVLNSIQNLAKNLAHLKEKNCKLLKYAENSCISQIATGKIDEAVKVFKDLKDDLRLSQIIKSVYTECGGNAKIVNILDFITELDSCREFETAYKELVKAISDWNNVSPELIFSIYGDIALHSTCSCSSLLTLKNKLEIEVDRVVVEWSGQFQKGMLDKCNPIVDYAMKPRFDYVMRNRILPIFIQEAYNKMSSNAKDIIKFISGLPNIDQSVAGYSTLFNWLRSFPKDLEKHQLWLAYKVKKIMEMDDYRFLDQSFKDKCTTIRDSLPSSVRSLIWNGSNCTIRNRAREEYLYASEKPFTTNQQYVYTRVSGKVESDAYWAIASEDSGESFTLRNTFYNKYLHASDDYHNGDDNERRDVHLWMGETQVKESSWILESTDNAQYFRLKSIKHEEYLYSDGAPRMLDNDERRVFVWALKDRLDIIHQEYDWVISC